MEDLCHDSIIEIFKSIQSSLGLKLPLDAYLLKPVQRISKYQLLLKEMNKNCLATDKPVVEKALEAMLDVVKNLNDVMHASFIVGCKDSLKSFGRLLKRDQLQMSKLKRNTSNNRIVNRLKLNNDTNKSVEVFLFEMAILICKRKTDDPASNYNQFTTQLFSQSSFSLTNNSSNSLSSASSLSSNSSSFNNFQYFYQFKEHLKTNEIGLTENFKADRRKFEIWSDSFSYIFEVIFVIFLLS